MSSAASWAGVASPSITAPIAARASSIDRVPPIDDRGQRGADQLAHRTRPDAAHGDGSRGVGSSARPAVANEPLAASSRDASPSPAWRRKFGEQMRALRREHGLGVELDALERQRDVADAHHDAVDLAHRGHPELGRQRRRVDRQRVVAGGHERRRHAREQAGAVVGHLGRLAVDEGRARGRSRRRTRRPSTASRGTRRAAGSPGRAATSIVVDRHAGVVRVARPGRDDDPAQVRVRVVGERLDARPGRSRRCGRPGRPPRRPGAPGRG